MVIKYQLKRSINESISSVILNFGQAFLFIKTIGIGYKK